jgi:xanthine dehydrogenase accessory factor
MLPDLAREEASLIGRREAYARATVVWSRSPVSTRPGDAALVTADGGLLGWVGGSCAEPLVVRQALAAIADGAPRLLHLGPSDELPPERDGLVILPVTCASEGSVEVFVEPRLPRPHLAIAGRSPMVHALATMAGAVGFEVVVIERDDVASEIGGAPVVHDLDMEKADVGPDSFVVVATMGRYDEDALESALASRARYIALVASERRAAAVRDTLRVAGVADEQLTRVRAPAGMALGELPHVEIAVAILAEIVAEKARTRWVPPSSPADEQLGPSVDPVCGMTVETGGPADQVTHGGVTYRFCCSGCRRRFEAAPERYVPA